MFFSRKKSLLFLLLIPYGLSSQISTRGKDFWLGFMDNYTAPQLQLFISSDRNVTYTVSIPGLGFSQSGSLLANTGIQITLPGNAYSTQSGVVENLGIHVESCDTISLYALNYGAYTADAAVIYPTHALGTRYRVMNINGSPKDWGKEYMVVATQNGTQISINGGAPINMNQGNVYQVKQSDNPCGTLIESIGACKPIAVYVGSYCVNIGGCKACDHLYEQILPIEKWGYDYFIIPYVGKSGMTYMFTADQNGTSISINGGAPINLNAGQCYNGSGGAGPLFVSSNKPIQVMQFCNGGNCDNVGDPFQILEYPIQQKMFYATFYAFPTAVITNYYCNVVTKTANTGLLLLDGAPIGGWSVIPGNPAYSYARPNIAAGFHTLKSDSGFLASVYGFGLHESFGYPVGASLNDPTSNFTVTPQPACAGTILSFTAQADPNVVSYQWNFGDGNNATGSVVTHSYSTDDFYDVTMIKNLANGCQVTVPKTINVSEGGIDITGTPSVCIGQSATLSIPKGNVPVRKVNACGDTIIVGYVQTADSIVWAHGDTGFVISVTPTVNTTYYAYGFVKGNPNCATIDSFVVNVNQTFSDFNFTHLNCPNEQVNFYSLANATNSYTISQYNWYFGTGATSTLTNPSYTYNSAGTYTVSLSVTSSAGCKDSISKTIYINQQPTANFTFSNVCYYSPATFTDTSIPNDGNIVQWNWDLGDGNASTSSNPSHQYASPGMYTVSLIVQTDSTCYDTIQKVIVTHPQPSANFNTSNVCVYDSAHFVNTSSVSVGSIAQSFWDFGDNSASTLTNPNHLYNNNGTYTVTLIVKSDSVCYDTVQKTILIHPQPQANFSYANICIYNSANFLNTSTISQGNIINYYWDLGDGNTSSNINVTHQYGNVGIYTVSLIAQSDSSCYDTIRKVIYIHPQPVAAFTFTNDCVYNNALFSDSTYVPGGGSIVQWNWNFGNGQSSTAQNPQHLYNFPGTYTVTLVVKSDSSCYDTISKSIIRYPQPNANFTFFDQCVYDTVYFNDLSNILSPDVITQWNWNFGNGNTSNSMNPSQLYSVYGDYTVSLVVTSNHNCSDTVNKPIHIHPQPVANFIADSVCVNVPPTQFNDLSIVPNYMSDTISSWFWYFGDGGLSYIQNPSHTYLSDGVYTTTLIVSSNFGCMDTISKNVIVYEKPVSNFTASLLSSCSPLCTQLNDLSSSASSNIISWQWILNGTTSYTYSSQNVSECLNNDSYTNVSLYDVTLIAENSYGCFDTLRKSNYLSVYPTPLADFIPLPQDTNIFASNITFNNLSIGGSNFTWHFGDGSAPFNTTTNNSVQHDYLNWGTYWVGLEVKNQYGCYNTISLPVNIEPIITIYVPDVFTPNGDGINDGFIIKGYGLDESTYELYIFDRWGEKIFYTNKFEPWDGTVDGKPAKQDVYVYKLKIIDINGKKHDKVGHVTLLRTNDPY